MSVWHVCVRVCAYVVIKGARAERASLRLIDHGGQNLRVAMALVHRRVRTQKVKVLLALWIPHVHTRCARDHAW